MESDEQQLSHLPDELIEAIRDDEARAPLITSKVDREVAQLAAQHFAGRRHASVYLRPAMAAAVVLAVTSFLVFQPQYSSRDQQPYTDVDRSGQIDIADVLALARDDEAISQQQLDSFAMSIVRLGTNGETS